MGVFELSVLDIEDLKIFNQVIPYVKDRMMCDLIKDDLITKLDDRVRQRVIASILTPNPMSLRLYQEVLNGVVVEDVVGYVIKLYKKLATSCCFERLFFVAVLRSGFLLAVLLRYIIYRRHKIKIDVVAITPNYIDKIFLDLFTDCVDQSNKDVLFVDGWCSEGVTYNILKKFWQNLYPYKKFRYAVLSNVSRVMDGDLLWGTRNDVLAPWSMCQTDNLGLSNYFVHPTNGYSSAFIITADRKLLENSESIYREIVDRQLKDAGILNSLDSSPEIGNLTIKQMPVSMIKFGINECIKAIDKRDKGDLYISNHLKKIYSDVLREYAKISGIKHRPTEQPYCFFVKNFSQK